MAGRELDMLERTAGGIVATVLAGREEPRDVEGAPDGTHDFDIELPNGVRFALEVTSVGDEQRLSLWAAMARQDWLAPSLAHDWVIGVRYSGRGEPGTNIKRLMAAAPSLLAVFEAHGISEVESRSPQAVGTQPEEVANALTSLWGLGATHATAWGRRTGSEAQLLVLPHTGLSGDPSRVSQLVKDAADDNLSKLLAADAAERHLFIWLNASESEAELGLATLPQVLEAPSIPRGIDAVWLATQGMPGYGQANVNRLLLARPPGEWQKLDPSVADRGERA